MPTFFCSKACFRWAMIEERFGEAEEDLYFYRGYKRYEMSNHLGNVLVVISDKRTPVCDGGVSHFEAEVPAAKVYAVPP